MSCRDMRMPIVCRWKAFASGIEIESEKAMKRLINLTQCAAIVFFALQFCLAVFAQGQKASLGATEEVSQTSQTGAGMGSAGTTAGKSGKADGTGNPELGGGRPLYRLHRRDGGALSFRLAPGLVKTVTGKPAAFGFLKEAGSVLA